MAREYQTVEIDGILYEVHKTKLGTVPIGGAPVRMFGDGDPFVDFVNSASSGELELIVTDWKYGNAVRLQGMARKCMSGGGYTDADHNRIFNELSVADPNWLQGFVGKGNDLDKACKAEWQRQKDENPADTDADKVWTELL